MEVGRMKRLIGVKPFIRSEGMRCGWLKQRFVEAGYRDYRYREKVGPYWKEVLQVEGKRSYLGRIKFDDHVCWQGTFSTLADAQDYLTTMANGWTKAQKGEPKLKKALATLNEVNRTLHEVIDVQQTIIDDLIKTE